MLVNIIIRLEQIGVGVEALELACGRRGKPFTVIAITPHGGIDISGRDAYAIAGSSPRQVNHDPNP